LFLGYVSDDSPETLSDFYGLTHVSGFADDAVLPVQVREEGGELLFGQRVGLGLLRHVLQCTSNVEKNILANVGVC
jgi:hypothetical protein